MSIPYHLMDPKLTDEEFERGLAEHRRLMATQWRLLGVACSLAAVALILFAIIWARS